MQYEVAKALVFLAAIMASGAAEAMSAKQLAVSASTLTKQMSDAKALQECINADYQKELVSNSIELREALVNFPTREITVARKRLEQQSVGIKAMPPCVEAHQVFGDDASTAVISGSFAGREIYQSDNTVALGTWTGRKVWRSPYSTNVGSAAGEYAVYSPSSVNIGASAGRNLADGDHAINIGGSAGYAAKSVNYSTLIGYAAGRFVAGLQYANVFGYAAGEYAHRSSHLVAAGTFAAYEANDATRSIMLGRFAGGYAAGAALSVMIGNKAGMSAKKAVRSVFLGDRAGSLSANTKDIVLIGTNAQAEPSVKNATGLGKDVNVGESDSFFIAPSQVGAPGVMQIDAHGKVTSSDALAQALATIAQLEARIEALESR